MPHLTGIAPILTPIAAVALAVTMVGAVFVHLRRGEFSGAVLPLALLAGCVFVAWVRFSSAHCIENECLTVYVL